MDLRPRILRLLATGVATMTMTACNGSVAGPPPAATDAGTEDPADPEPPETGPGPVAPNPVDPDPVDPGPGDPDPGDPSPVDPDAVVFFDSFESGDMSATNTDGFRWARNNRTSVVTATHAVWNNGPIMTPIPAGRDWTAHDGEHSLRFRYPALEAWAEQRFALGAAYPEIWIRYWIRVPTNFVHENPTGSSANNKFFALWMDDYSQHGEGATVVWNFWPDGGGDSRHTLSLSNEANGFAGHHSSYSGFMRSPEDQGRWMQVVLHAVVSSSATSNDGEARLYRRWEGETGFTLVSESVGRGLVTPSGGPDGWAAGYVMGWSNSGYVEDTEFLVDEFTVATTSLLD